MRGNRADISCCSLVCREASDLESESESESESETKKVGSPRRIAFSVDRLTGRLNTPLHSCCPDEAEAAQTV